MFGVVPEPVRRKRLKSRDSTKMKIQSGNDEEGKKMRDDVREVKDRKTSAATSLEKGNKKQRLNNAEEEEEMGNGDRRTKNSGVPGTLSEKEWKKEKLNKYNIKKKMMVDDNNRKKMQIRDDKEVNNKDKVNKTHREKMRAANSGRKILNGHSRVKSGEVSTAFFGKEKKGKKLNKPTIGELQSNEDEEGEKRNCDSKVKKGMVSATFSELSKKKKRANDASSEKEPTLITPAVKQKRMRPSESMETKMRHDKHKRRNVASDISNDKKMDTSSSSDYNKRKREEPHTLFKKEKRTCCSDSDSNNHSGRMKEKKSDGVEGKNRQALFSFFKFTCNNFEEFLVIPPTVAPRLKNLTNQHVYLKDSEGRHSQVMLSVVGGNLAFHQGWNIFVSNHLIKHGEFLLFEYVTIKKFYVRVFGSDSCERLCFNVDNKSKGFRKKQTWSNMSPDDLVCFDGNSENTDDGNYVSGEYTSSKVPETCNITVNTKKDPKRVEHEVGSGPGAQDRNGNLIAQVRNGNLIDPQCKTSLCSKEKTVILILDSESSANENGDTVKLTTSDADSDTQHVAVNTNEDPKRAHSGIGNGSSVVLDDEKGSFPPMCSEEKTRSEIIVTDAAPLTHENDDREGHELELHESDEDLGRKWGLNSIPSDSVTDVVKYYNHSKMNMGQNLCMKYEAPGGSRCLEKWKKGILNNQAALDATTLIKPKNPQVNKSRHSGTEIDHSTNKSERDGGASVQLGTKGEQLEPSGNIVNSQRNNNDNPPCLNPTGPVKCGALGLNPPVSKGTCAFVESRFTLPTENSKRPDGISKCGSSRIEIDHTVNGKGTATQNETKMDQVEPVGSGVCSQISNIVVHANHVVAHKSEHCLSKQEGIKSIKCEVPEFLLPIKDKTLGLDDHSPLKIKLQLCTPDTSQKWLELPKSLSIAVRQKRHGRNVILLKDPMKRLWPVLYHENPVFVGFTSGWKHFVAANNLQTGDIWELTKEPDEDELVYSVKITGQRL